MAVKTLRELEAKLRPYLQKALVESVAPVVKETMLEMVIQEVYDVYPNPILYQRRYANGGLADMENMDVAEFDDGIVIRNVTTDDRTGRLIAPVVEYAEGYNYPFEYANTPRPFIQATRDELESSKKHVKAMAEGLKAMGIKVRE